MIIQYLLSCQNTYFTDGYGVFIIHLRYRFQLEVTGGIRLSKPYKVRYGIVHDVAELTACLTFSPRLAVEADVESILIDSPR